MKPVFKYAIKPCRILRFCPYGSIVENYPIVETFPLPRKDEPESCSVFGHQCPVFFHAGPLVDEGEVSTEDSDRWFTELKERYG